MIEETGIFSRARDSPETDLDQSGVLCIKRGSRPGDPKGSPGRLLVEVGSLKGDMCDKLADTPPSGSDRVDIHKGG